VIRRATFLAGAAAFAAIRPALAQGIAVEDLVERFPGVIGIYARTLALTPPEVTVRDGEPFAAASVIKLAIMLTVFRAYDAGETTPQKEVVLHPGDIIGGAPILGNASSGERWPIGTLVNAMIRYSDNIAANALISSFGFKLINETIQSAGMTGTVLARHFADVVPPGQQNRNVTTPRDIGTLLYQIERGAHEGIPTVATTQSCRAMIEIMLGQQFRDMIPAGIHRKVQIANKTGELDYTRNDAAIVDPFGDAPYILVVLTRDLEYPSLAPAEIAQVAQRVDNAMRRVAKASGENA
jgi:beta-lactamase class A